MLGSFLLALLPSPLQEAVRRVLGQRIHHTASVRFGTVLRADVVDIGPHASIGPFSFVQARSFKAGAYSVVKPLSLCRASEVRLGAYAHIAPTAVISAPLSNRSSFIVGDHSRIFPFCWLEPGEGITIGDQSAVGGHSLIFTHGAWPDYLRGGPVTFGPVVIEDNVWLAWRVIVLANMVIGKNSIVAAGSVVNKSVPANSLAAGAPAKIITNRLPTHLSDAERHRRAQRILGDYGREGLPSREVPEPRLSADRLQFTSTISIDDPANLREGDLLFSIRSALEDGQRRSLLARKVSVIDHARSEIVIASSRPYLLDFVAFLRRYGIRLSVSRFGS